MSLLNKQSRKDHIHSPTVTIVDHGDSRFHSRKLSAGGYLHRDPSILTNVDFAKNMRIVRSATHHCLFVCQLIDTEVDPCRRAVVIFVVDRVSHPYQSDSISEMESLRTLMSSPYYPEILSTLSFLINDDPEELSIKRWTMTSIEPLSKYVQQYGVYP